MTNNMSPQNLCLILNPQNVWKWSHSQTRPLCMEPSSDTNLLWKTHTHIHMDAMWRHRPSQRPHGNKDRDVIQLYAKECPGMSKMAATSRNTGKTRSFPYRCPRGSGLAIPWFQTFGFQNWKVLCFGGWSHHYVAFCCSNPRQQHSHLKM